MNKLIDEAREFALKKHEGQMYGKNEPYSIHLEDVARRVAEDGLSDVHVAVAWLHDILEDTDVLYDELEALFGHEVAKAVYYMTKVKGEMYADYLECVSVNPISVVVKIHDLKSNLGAAERKKKGKLASRYINALEYLECHLPQNFIDIDFSKSPPKVTKIK